jgi:hypothetical protein
MLLERHRWSIDAVTGSGPVGLAAHVRFTGRTGKVRAADGWRLAKGAKWLLGAICVMAPGPNVRRALQGMCDIVPNLVCDTPNQGWWPTMTHGRKPPGAHVGRGARRPGAHGARSARRPGGTLA